MLNIADIRQKLRGYRNILPLSGISFPNFFLIIEDFSVENTLNLGLRGLALTHASAWTRGCQSENRPNSMQIIAVPPNSRPVPPRHLCIRRSMGVNKGVHFHHTTFSPFWSSIR